MENSFKEVLKTHLSTPYSQKKIEEKGLTYIKSKIKSLRYYYSIDEKRNKKTSSSQRWSPTHKIWGEFKNNIVREFSGSETIKN